MKKSNTIELIKALSNANGVSGFEDEVLTVVRQNAPDFLSIEEDVLRNLYLYPKKNNRSKPVVMVEAHSDELGFMVQAITSNGMLKFLQLGTWIPQVILGQRVRVRNAEGQYIPGVIAPIPPHMMNDKEMNSVWNVEDMVIDVGASSKAEIMENYNIELGAPVVPDVNFSFDTQNNVMFGKAFDNRIGCAAVLKTLSATANEQLAVELVGTLASQEELRTRGIQVAVNRVKPDIAIVFEGPPADDTYGSAEFNQCALKKGPQIRHRDRSMITSPRFTKFARSVAKEIGLPFQDAVRIKGGNDGSIINLSNQGIPVIVIGTPVRYVHSHYCFCAIDDFLNAVKWCTEIIKRLDETVISGF